LVDWQIAHAPLCRIRQQVFIEEQRVPIELEWDGLDEAATHLLATDVSGAIGCARILPSGQIGRMAVIREKRRQGIGRALLQQAITVCQSQGWQPIRLSAQEYAIPFYEQAGFRVCSEIYMDANIPHRDMVLDLSI
jgi:predicted GNAT family N-acyltransferase